VGVGALQHLPGWHRRASIIKGCRSGVVAIPELYKHKELHPSARREQIGERQSQKLRLGDRRGSGLVV